MSVNLLTHLSKCYGTDNVETVARRAAEELVGSDLHPYDAGHRFVDRRVTEALQNLGVTVEKVGRSEASYLGRLYTTRSGFTIKIVEEIPPTTFRFVLSHELAHTLSYKASGTGPRRRFGNSKIEERVCDRIARQVLIPEDLLGNDLELLRLDDDPMPIADIKALSQDYAVKPWQIVRRVAERRPDLSEHFVAILWKQTEPTVFIIVDSVHPDGIFVPARDRSFSDASTNHFPWRIRNSIAAASTLESVRVGSLSGDLETSGFSYNFGGHHWVVQLSRLDEKHRGQIDRWRAARTIRRSRSS